MLGLLLPDVQALWMLFFSLIYGVVNTSENRSQFSTATLGFQASTLLLLSNCYVKASQPNFPLTSVSFDARAGGGLLV